MKLFGVLFHCHRLFIACAVLVIDAATDAESWKQFQQNHGKIYKSALEEQHRYNIFKSNLKTIEEHNLKYENGDVTYYLGINKFADWTNDEFKDMLKLQRKVHKPKTYASSPRLNVTLADFVDWRQSNAVSEVKNQNCGDCWAFSSTGALEGQLALKYGQLISMSEQNLLDCTLSYGNGGCDGGLMMYSYQYAHDFGIESEQDYPYKGAVGNCRFDETKSLLKVNYYVDLESTNEYALQDAVANIGPISVAVDANYLGLYAGGVFNHPECSSTELNHGVLAVGYGVENNIPYWIVKNSWGADYGENGYVRIIRNSNNQCGIATAALYPTIY